MYGFVENIEGLTETNNNFRKVLYTSKHIQLVVMSLKFGENIGSEKHSNVDQFIRIESGRAVVTINDVIQHVKAGDAIIIPAGSTHDVFNNYREPLKLYTIYGPPNHKDKLVNKTKQDAQ